MVKKSINKIRGSFPRFGADFPWKRFFAEWAAIFVVLFFVSVAIGFAPAGARDFALFFAGPRLADSPSSSEVPPSDANTQATAVVSETWLAPRIVIPKISVDSPLVLPTSKDFSVLNNSLLNGAVRYPGSAMPGESGNVLIFGHSTFLPVVYNSAYKVFSRIKELKNGDVVEVRSDTRGYVYVVKKVEVKEADDTRIDLSSDKKILTLSTCKIIGGDKESRYVVTAEFLRSYPLGT